MPNLTFNYIEDVLDRYDLFLIDLWGVIVEGNLIYPGVIATINKIMTTKQVLFLSNAPRPNFIVAKTLNRWGISTATSKTVMTSGEIARTKIHEFTATHGKLPKIFHLGTDRNTDILLQIPHNITDDITTADILLLTLYRDENEQIDEFNHLLTKAAQASDLTIICANPDTTIPNQGLTRYCPGYYAQIIEQAGGTVIYTGKPHQFIYQQAFALYPNIDKRRILMIGDTLETDILGANNSSIDSALVLTGNAAKHQLACHTLQDKLEKISQYINTLGIYPTFITNIAKDLSAQNDGR